MAKFKPMSPDAMKAPIKRPLCGDPKPMTPARIFEIARRADGFTVTWHYRNDALRNACRKMVAAGLLRRSHSGSGEDVYHSIILPKATAVSETPQ